MSDAKPIAAQEIWALAQGGGLLLALESAGDRFASAASALDMSGQTEAAEILRSALNLAFKDRPPTDLQGRGAALDKLSDDAIAQIESLSDAFTDLPDPGELVEPDLPQQSTRGDSDFLARQYERMTLDWVEIGLSNVSKANKLMKRKHEIAMTLRATPDGRAALHGLISNASPHVRIAAANECLFWDDPDALAELERLDGAPGQSGLSAHWILRSYRDGTRNRSY